MASVMSVVVAATPPQPAAPASSRTPPPVPAPQAQPLDLSASMRRVDQTFADTGPLATSLRQLPPDLRVPGDFRDVYQIPADANSPYAGWYARRSGAVTAVFPRSQYDYARGGLVAVVPNDTRYVLGPLPSGPRVMPRPSALAAPSTRVDLRADSTVNAASQPVQMRADSERVDERRDRSPTAQTNSPRADQSATAEWTAYVDGTPKARDPDHRVTASVARLFSDEAFRARRVSGLLGLKPPAPSEPQKPATEPPP